MHKRVMNKLGVSAVVATVLIIMITIAAIGIIWAAIIPMVRDNLGTSATCNEADVSIGTVQGYTCYDSAQKKVAVQTIKGTNNINVTGLKFSVSYSGNSVLYNETFNFEKSSSRVSYIDVITLEGVDSIGVVPVLSNGKDSKECTKVVLSNIPSCSLGTINTINDEYYPVFSAFITNTGILPGKGTGVFNVTVLNTNGTVILEVNNTKHIATSLGNGKYSASHNFVTNGTYSYKWYSFGNGTAKNYNVSGTNNYVIDFAFTGGEGSTISPYQVASWKQLDNVRYYLDKSFVLTTSLSSSSAEYLDYAGPNANGGSGWEPVGECGSGDECNNEDYTYTFNGNFNGNGYNVSDLIINDFFINYTGLFGYSTGNISNVGLINTKIAGAYYVGGLLGWQRGGIISNSYLTGNVTSSSGIVGGLVGVSYSGRIFNSYSIANVVGTGFVGGLIGYQYYGSITNSYSTANISGEGNYAGSLVAYNYFGNISNSYSTGNVFCNGSYVGGLVGINYGTISNSFYLGNAVRGWVDVGGLAGYSQGNISNSYSTGYINGTNYVGGLIGLSIETVSNSYSTGNVTGVSMVGGFIGYQHTLSAVVSNSYSTGNVSGRNYIGGFIGYQTNGTINNSYSTGKTVRTGNYDGGFIGYRVNGFVGFVSNSFWDNQTSGKSNMCGSGSCTGATGKNTTQMKTASTFTSTGWDFTNVWNINSPKNSGYPYLSWQTF